MEEEVFQAEEFVILEVATKEGIRDCLDQEISIYSDSQDALKTILILRASSSVV